MTTPPPTAGHAGTLDGNDAVAESIAARDLNNLYLTSCYFRDQARYRAFCALYAVMRVVDDRVDELPPRRTMSAEAIGREHAVLEAWQAAMSEALVGRRPSVEHIAACDHPEAKALLHAATDASVVFPLPTSLWRNFFAAMHQDVDQPRFATYTAFLDYTEGASVAPTTIYLALLAARDASGSGVYRVPETFDLIGCGRALGTFAYLAHILRDLAEDLETGDEGLIYLAADDMAKHDLDDDELRHDVARRHAGDALRALTAELAGRAQQALDTGRRLLVPLDGRLERDCAYVLELILTIYDRILDAVAAADNDPLTGALDFSGEEKARIAAEVAERTGFVA